MLRRSIFSELLGSWSPVREPCGAGTPPDNRFEADAASQRGLIQGTEDVDRKPGTVALTAGYTATGIRGFRRRTHRC